MRKAVQHLTSGGAIWEWKVPSVKKIVARVDGGGVHESKICGRAKKQPAGWEEIFDTYTPDRDRYLKNSVENATANHQKPNNPINKQLKKQSDIS